MLCHHTCRLYDTAVRFLLSTGFVGLWQREAIRSRYLQPMLTVQTTVQSHWVLEFSSTAYRSVLPVVHLTPPLLVATASREAPRERHKCSVMHLHSVFLWPTWAAAGIARTAHIPYVISPRGMLVKDLIKRSAGRSKWLGSSWLRKQT